MNKLINICHFLILIAFLFPQAAHPQRLLDTFGQSPSRARTDNLFANLPTERIEKISESRRVFIITNTNQSIYRGDYITLVLNSELAVRALVAQISRDNLAGIKILQIYSLTQWNRLREGREVQIIRGDDSAYFREAAPEIEDTIISDERDLFDDTTFLDDDIIFQDETSRVLEQSNLLSLSLGFVQGIDNDTKTRRYRMIQGSWAYQFQDNIFVELSYGRTNINAFPAAEIDTVFTNLSLRFKYVVKLPLFSYIKPYVGYQILDADSPGAQSQDELRLVDQLKAKQFAFGATLLRRLVPGWFIRADLGSDLYAVGFSLEF